MYIMFFRKPSFDYHFENSLNSQWKAHQFRNKRPFQFYAIIFEVQCKYFSDKLLLTWEIEKLRTSLK